MDAGRTGDRTQMRIHAPTKFGLKLFTRALCLQRLGIAYHDEGKCDLPFYRIGHAHHRHFSPGPVTAYPLFYLPRAQPVSRHVDHVVGASEDGYIAVFVGHAPVEGRIKLLPRHAFPVRLDEPRIVAPYRRHTTRRQRITKRDHAFLARRADLASRLVSYGQSKA